MHLNNKLEPSVYLPLLNSVWNRSFFSIGGPFTSILRSNDDIKMLQYYFVYSWNRCKPMAFRCDPAQWGSWTARWTTWLPVRSLRTTWLCCPVTGSTRWSVTACRWPRRRSAERRTGATRWCTWLATGSARCRRTFSCSGRNGPSSSASTRWRTWTWPRSCSA